MNRDQRNRFRDRHLQYQYELMHILPSVSTNPDHLSGLYLKKFYNSSKRYQLTLPVPLIEKNSGKFCPKCGVVRIPGINLTMEKRISTTGNEAILKYSCKLCQENSSTSLGEEIVVKNHLSKSNTPTPLRKNSDGQKDVKISKGNSAKSRAKKRKMNSLSNLLSKKNKETKNNKGGILSLESFMKR